MHQSKMLLKGFGCWLPAKASYLPAWAPPSTPALLMCYKLAAETKKNLSHSLNLPNLSEVSTCIRLTIRRQLRELFLWKQSPLKKHQRKPPGFWRGIIEKIFTTSQPLVAEFSLRASNTAHGSWCTQLPGVGSLGRASTSLSGGHVTWTWWRVHIKKKWWKNKI